MQAVVSEAEDAGVLLAAVGLGDREAFRRLYELSAASLYPICLRILRNRDAAADALQDAFFRIWQKAYLFDRSKGSAFGWMASVTRRCTLDRLSPKERLHLPIEEVSEEALNDAIGADQGVSGGRVLTRCLKLLDAKFRGPILMAYYYGLTHEELADKMSAPLGTVKSWITRGLAKLKDCMG
jgi:RNA polymerase sigma-70 factor, ECF subfamily